jgi:hypothetical protein
MIEILAYGLMYMVIALGIAGWAMIPVMVVIEYLEHRKHRKGE